jgi:hypothetical protein
MLTPPAPPPEPRLSLVAADTSVEEIRSRLLRRKSDQKRERPASVIIESGRVANMKSMFEKSEAAHGPPKPVFRAPSSAIVALMSKLAVATSQPPPPPTQQEDVPIDTDEPPPPPPDDLPLDD